MKKTLFALLLAGTTFLLTQCKPEEQPMPQDEAPKYSIQILSPDTQAKHVGDTIQIQVQFDEENGDIVHHINVKIYEKNNDSNVIYNMPTDAHVYQLPPYTYEDPFVLNVPEHSDWVLEAGVWGHENMEGMKTSSIEFHVHPR